MHSQLELKRLNSEAMHKAEVETINSLIITYNHEINNPLAVAIGLLPLLKTDDESNKDKIAKIHTALRRISDIVVKIKELPQNPIEKENYTAKSKMFKL